MQVDMCLYGGEYEDLYAILKYHKSYHLTVFCSNLCINDHKGNF